MFRVEIVKERSDLFFRLKDKETIINITPMEHRLKGMRSANQYVHEMTRICWRIKV